MSENKTVPCTPTELFDFAYEVLCKLGTTRQDAYDMANQIVGSELAGHESHGMRRLAEYVDRVQKGFANPAGQIEIELDKGSLVRVNGNRGFGHIVMRDVTELVIERAQQFGITGVAVRNSEYAGRFYDFSETAAEAGIITLIFANNAGGGQVAGAPGSLEKRLSTSPVSFGFPRQTSPHFVLDMALTSVAMGRVSEWKDRGETIPPEWVNSAGVLQFFGGFKGFGMALLVEALAGALADSGVVDEGVDADEQGVFMIGVDVSALRDLDEFTTDVERFIAHVKNTPLEEGYDPIRIPGESSAQNARERRGGGLLIQDFTWKKLAEIANELRIEPPRELTS